MSRRKKSDDRGYAVTMWGRAFLDVVQHHDDLRRITKARSYFRDRKVVDLVIRSGLVTAYVQGSQLDPFAVRIRCGGNSPSTVVDLLRASGDTDAIVAVTRGSFPAALADLVLPTEGSDVRTECDCPDDAPRCIHILAVTYELCAAMDADPTVLLSVMGVELRALLAELSQPQPDRRDPPRVEQADRLGTYFGMDAAMPPLPAPAPLHPFTDLDLPLLRIALRRSGSSAVEVESAIDELGELYDRLRPQ